MKTYQTYSTAIKIYYSLGLQNQFVAKDIRSKIPFSTASSWKNHSFSTIIGVDLEKNIHQNLSDIQLLYHPYGTIPRKIATAQIRLIILLISCFSKPVFQKAIRKKKTELINFLERFEGQISYRQLSKILGVSTKTIYHWRVQVKFKCEASPLLLCVKRHPNQATIAEVSTIKQWLSKSEYAHWGIHSIWAVAFKEGITHLSKQAWYHYNNLLAIRNSAITGNKKKHNPLIAECVNQIWHADITVFKTLDGVRHYIYTVMDNYSRYIHSWRIETVVSAKIRLETIQEALQNAFQGSEFQNLQLVTDGGPENDNQTLKAFMTQNQATIHHTIALRDIVQSNSMVEAFYRVTKYSWLYLKTIADGIQLKIEMENWMHEYHLTKPHYSLGIYTPYEILSGNNKQESFSERMKLAAQKRREINRNAHCKIRCNE